MRDASSVDRYRRTLLVTAPLALSAVFLGGCARPALSTTDLAAALDARLAAADRVGFLALFAAQPGPQALADRVYRNLAAQTGTSPSPAARIATASAGQLRVNWSFPGEPTVVSQATMSIADGLLVNLAALGSGTEWLGEPMLVSTASRLVVAGSDHAALTRWSAAADAGLRALALVAPEQLRRADPLVVLIPADLVAFSRYSGVGAERTAAVTVVPGTNTSEGLRVVVNPLTPADPAADAVTITHEAVHAGMGSPRLTGTPGWLLEGIAEGLTAQAHRPVAATNRKLARSAIADGLPVSLPDTDSGEPSGYALAMVAALAMVDQVGWAAVLAEAERRSDGGGRINDQQVLAWYRDALARLD